MNSELLGLLAETSIHPGAGQSSGIIDLPVAREAATNFPVVPGSSVKGALLGLARQRQMAEPERKRVFGESDNAGALLVSDARLLLLPVRSLSSAYKWITCPHLLERFARDRRRSSGTVASLEIAVAESAYLGAKGGDLFLEERQFSHGGELPGSLVESLGGLISHPSTRARLGAQLVVLHDDDFAWFSLYALAVQARNVLEEESKMSKNLWYEETIPADALFYLILSERQPGALDAARQLFSERPYLQVGGNETVGMGWFAVSIPTGSGGAA